jgi:hypothetical protein
MIFQGASSTDSYTLSLRDNALTVSVDEQEVIACDRAGRLYSVYRNGCTYRRGLNGRVLRKWRDEDSRHRHWLSDFEADALVDAASATLRHLLDALRRPEWHWSQPPDLAQCADLTTALERGAQFDGETARHDAARFNRLYCPIGILPPDQYLALVLQATEGCSFSTCTFCDLYHQDFRVKPVSEFRQHIADVREHMGDSLSLRGQSVFLGAANALAVPMPRLLPLFEAMSHTCESPHYGVYAFLDGFTGKRKTADDYRTLAALGLRRVYVGLESGHDPLLDFVRKPGRSADAVETVREIKAAGVNVGVIVMIGLGGDKFAEGHVADTVAALNAMPLGAGDLLYFSDLVEEPGALYPALAASQAIRPLAPGERTAQRQAIREQLVFAGSPPKISNYDIREFVY